LSLIQICVHPRKSAANLFGPSKSLESELSRIEAAFSKLKREEKPGLIPFITAGDPDLETTAALLLELANSGATLIELGVPFSDPMADGPVIQRASERALKRGFGLEEIFATVAKVRSKIETPLVLFSYFNPLMQYGIGKFARAARDAGIDGILVTDLTPEESQEFANTLKTNDLDMILLVAPTSTDERLRMITAHASGFVYAVSRAGVTGARENLSHEAELLVARVRKFSSLPVAVGFGISSAEQVAETCRYADAAVVGSAIVAQIEKLSGSEKLVEEIGQFVRGLIPAGAKTA
jgi:tryptophan synthase alpha chain